MLLVLSVISIASVVLYMGYKRVKTTNEKLIIIGAYLLLLGIAIKYSARDMFNSEGFKVSVDEEEFMNDVEELDNEVAAEETTTTNSNTTTTKPSVNVFEPKLEVDLGDKEK